MGRGAERRDTIYNTTSSNFRSRDLAQLAAHFAPPGKVARHKARHGGAQAPTAGASPLVLQFVKLTYNEK